jgi:secreted trypsin-like serine protease
MVNDVALMRLSKPTNNIQPIALAAAQEYTTGLQTKALGWGTTSQGGDASSKLRIVTVPLVSHNTCTATPSYPGDIDQATMICAGYPQGSKDSCQGDSGGPLMHQGSDGVAKLYGVVSWGEGCAQKNKYGVYAKVSAFHSWVKKQTNNEVNPDQPPSPGTPTSAPTVATISPTLPITNPGSGWEGWLAESRYCKAIRNRRRCAQDPRCDFKSIKGLNRGRKKCFPSRAICLPQ